jgi:hypothetical protein
MPAAASRHVQIHRRWVVLGGLEGRGRAQERSTEGQVNPAPGGGGAGQAPDSLDPLMMGGAWWPEGHRKVRGGSTEGQIRGGVLMLAGTRPAPNPLMTSGEGWAQVE